MLNEDYWREGRRILLGLGLQSQQVGQLLGKWAQGNLGRLDQVIQVLDRADRAKPVHPVSWITAILIREGLLKPSKGRQDAIEFFAGACFNGERAK